MIDQFPQVGDNGEVNDDDYVLDGENTTLATLVAKMPVMNTISYVLNQYSQKKYNTSCTKFSGITNFCTLFDHYSTYEEVDKIEEQSLKDGRKGPGNGWSSSQGMQSAARVYNSLYPTKSVTKWLYDIDSSLFSVLLDKRMILNCSIVVDSNWWKEAKTGTIKGTKYKKDYGHATAIMQHPTDSSIIEFIDSVGAIKYKVTKEQFYALVFSGNIRSTGYLFIPNNFLQLPENFEILKAKDWKNRVLARQKKLKMEGKKYGVNPKTGKIGRY